MTGDSAHFFPEKPPFAFASEDTRRQSRLPSTAGGAQRQQRRFPSSRRGVNFHHPHQRGQIFRNCLTVGCLSELFPKLKGARPASAGPPDWRIAKSLAKIKSRRGPPAPPILRSRIGICPARFLFGSDFNSVSPSMPTGRGTQKLIGKSIRQKSIRPSSKSGRVIDKHPIHSESVLQHLREHFHSKSLGGVMAAINQIDAQFFG